MCVRAAFRDMETHLEIDGQQNEICPFVMDRNGRYSGVRTRRYTYSATGNNHTRHGAQHIAPRLSVAEAVGTQVLNRVWPTRWTGLSETY